MFRNQHTNVNLTIKDNNYICIFKFSNEVNIAIISTNNINNSDFDNSDFNTTINITTLLLHHHHHQGAYNEVYV